MQNPSYSFEARIASRGYHTYKLTTWRNADLGDEVVIEAETNPQSKAIDPYYCAIRTKTRLFGSHVTFGHVPREVSRHVFYFITGEGGSVKGKVESLTYQPSPIPQGGLEIPIQMTFTCDRYVT